MTARPFNWRDLTYLQQNRHNSIFLDSALVLTRGPMIVPGALFSFLAPGMGVFTAVNGSDNDQVMMGQVIHLAGAPFAHLTFVTPAEAFESQSFPDLLEYLISLAGSRGAFRLLADADESTSTFDVLRKSGFAIYGRQRIWQLTHQIQTPKGHGTWRLANKRDAFPIRLLYNNLVPGLVQQLEPFNAATRPHGMVLQQGEDLAAFVELKYGHRGIWAQPFVHPDAQDVPEKLFDLLRNMTSRGSRPVYICVRSYQSWLEPAIEELGAEAGPRQAVMAKHLGSLQFAASRAATQALESGQPEATSPIARSKRNE